MEQCSPLSVVPSYYHTNKTKTICRWMEWDGPIECWAGASERKQRARERVSQRLSECVLQFDGKRKSKAAVFFLQQYVVHVRGADSRNGPFKGNEIISFILRFDVGQASRFSISRVARDMRGRRSRPHCDTWFPPPPPALHRPFNYVLLSLSASAILRSTELTIPILHWIQNYRRSYVFDPEPCAHRCRRRCS